MEERPLLTQPGSFYCGPGSQCCYVIIRALVQGIHVLNAGKRAKKRRPKKRLLRERKRSAHEAAEKTETLIQLQVSQWSNITSSKRYIFVFSSWTSAKSDQPPNKRRPRKFKGRRAQREMKGPKSNIAQWYHHNSYNTQWYTYLSDTLEIELKMSLLHKKVYCNNNLGGGRNSPVMTSLESGITKLEPQEPFAFQAEIEEEREINRLDRKVSRLWNGCPLGVLISRSAMLESKRGW